MSAFGALVLPSDVEQHVREVLQTWMRDYVIAIESRSDTPRQISPIKSWTLATDEVDRFPEQQLPGILIAWNDAPVNHRAAGAGADVEMQIYAVVQGQNFENARDLAGIYSAAAWFICEQQLAGDPIAGVEVTNLSLRSNDGADRRWRAVGTVELVLTVDGMVAPDLGPAAPTDPGSTDPPPDYPEVDEVDISVLTDP